MREAHRTKTLWVREPYLSQILAGRKTVEVRVGYGNIRRLEPGDGLRLNDRHRATIRRVGRYADFAELLAHEDPAAIAPDLPSGELLAALRAIYPPEKEALGAAALEVSVQRYDVILFDMGYTLIYFEPSSAHLVREALQTLGIERAADEIRAAMDRVWRDYYQGGAEVTFPATKAYDWESELRLGRDLLAQLGVEASEAQVAAYRRDLGARFAQPGVVRPYAETVDVLAALREDGFRMGIVSNWGWNLRDRVAQAGLDGFFDVVWASAYAGCNKPHPGIFRQALAQMEAEPGRALYVGDSYEYDVVGARNAGIDVVLLDRRGRAGDQDCPVIADLRGVLSLLDGMAR